MGSNRFNQKANVPDYRPRDERKKEAEIILDLKPCLHCGKAITTGYYGSHEGGGTCNKKCDDAYQPKGENHETATLCTAFNGAIFRPC